MKYKHINKGKGTISINDGKDWHNLKPGDEIELDMKRPGHGIVVEEKKIEYKPKINITKGDDNK